MGYHADDEPELGPDPVVAAVSLGSARRFLLKRSKGRARAQELESRRLLEPHPDSAGRLRSCLAHALVARQDVG